MQDKWAYWSPYLVSFYKSNEEQSTQWEAEQKAEQEDRYRQWQQHQGQDAAASAANAGADAAMTNSTAAA